MKETYGALKSLERQKLVSFKPTGLLRRSGLYTITANGLETYRKIKNTDI